MKAAYIKRNEVNFDEAIRLAPSDTDHEQKKRVEEWTQKSTGAPPSNRKRSLKEQENLDHDAKSQLIAEAVRLMDTRDKQTRPIRTTTTGAAPTNHVYPDDSDDHFPVEESPYHLIGKHFRSSKLSARNYVKHFENHMRKKKVYEDAMSNTYPYVKSKKDLAKGLSKINALSVHQRGKPMIEPVSWRYRASRSVKFAVKTPSKQMIDALLEDRSDDGEKWITKQENDRDWWRWKLKQRVLQNEELLHQLAIQRKNQESARIQGEHISLTRGAIFSNKKPPKLESEKILVTPSVRNSSWHVSVEIPAHMTPSVKNKRSVAVPRIRASQQKSRDPMANFYTPSKQLVTAMTAPIPTDPSVNVDGIQKLKILKKDPYLSKLLEGNEIFKPEIMVDDQQNRKQISQDLKTQGGIPRRKLSLESLSDTDDELTASNFFNPDVQVLYERLSEMETNKLADKSTFLAGGLNSREPSDGFLNLSILLETGRFNHYNKLPTIKPLENNREGMSKQQQSRKSEKSYSTRLQSALNRMKKSTYLGNNQPTAFPLVASGIGPINSTEPIPAIAKPQIENLPTNQWAKKIIMKIKRQDIGTKTDDDGNLREVNPLPRRSAEINDILNLNLQQNKYKVPIDQKTNLLYHEILMSKWKKDKHIKEKDAEHGGKHKLAGVGAKWTRGEHVHDKNVVTDDRPRGLDIWLENIREKAKRDRVISPLPNTIETMKGMPPSELENSAFELIGANK